MMVLRWPAWFRAILHLHIRTVVSSSATSVSAGSGRELLWSRSGFLCGPLQLATARNQHWLEGAIITVHVDLCDLLQNGLAGFQMSEYGVFAIQVLAWFKSDEEPGQGALACANSSGG